MGRRYLPTTLMKNAIDNRDIETFCWACLEQARLDMGLPESDKVFSSHDTMSIVRQIVSLQKLNAKDPDAAIDQAEDLNQWLAKPQPKLIKKTL